jgi:hypothetical protein
MAGACTSSVYEPTAVFIWARRHTVFSVVGRDKAAGRSRRARLCRKRSAYSGLPFSLFIQVQTAVNPSALVSLAFWRVLEKKRGGAEAEVRIWPLGGCVLDEDCECTGLGCRR